MSSSESDMEMLNMLSDWSSESDSDEESAIRVYKERVDHMNTLDSYEFQLRFRLDKQAVEQLLTEIYPHLRIRGARNHGISPLHQLLLTLRFYALGTMLLSVADFIGVAKSSASRIIRDVSSAIARLYSDYIKIKSDTEQGFFQIARFPRVLGAIDGIHVRIQSPNSQIGEQFKNHKGYFSVNVQAVCDSNLYLMNVEAGPGSAEDATIFDNSELRAQCESGVFGNRWLLGDSAFPLKPYLLTPVLNPESRGELLYNKAQLQTSNCIKRCFAVWKRRFPVVALTMRLNLRNVHAVIIATAVLHNMCRMRSMSDVPPEVEMPGEDSEEPQSPGESIFNSDISNTERAILISDYFNKL